MSPATLLLQMSGPECSSALSWRWDTLREKEASAEPKAGVSGDRQHGCTFTGGHTIELDFCNFQSLVPSALLLSPL